MRIKINYKEGTWFAVPLRTGGYGVGVVARVKKPLLLAYFFGPRRESIPKIEAMAVLKACSSLVACRVADLGLVNQQWPIIGDDPFWNRSDWPMPVFVRREPSPPFKNWRVYYSDTDPGEVISAEREDNDRSDLPEDGLSGYGAAEIILTKLIGYSKETPLEENWLAKPAQLAGSCLTPVKGGPFRVNVLQQLRSCGSKTEKPHNFDFYLYLPLEASALTAAAKIREMKFTVEVIPNASADRWLCKAKKNLVPETAPLDEIEQFFMGLAGELHGEFDGWESDVIK